jgi:replication-associated recombination protein RarA
MSTFSEARTRNGHACGEVASALQKSIRRGDEREALYWASELDLAGYGNYCFKRLRIIASEDVGLGEPLVHVQVRCLYENWLEQRKPDKGDSLNAAVFLVHAVIVLARASKTRLVDSALMVSYEGERARLEIPDYALDPHTHRGRQLHRGQDHFFEEAARLENEAEEIRDIYLEEGRAARGKASTDFEGRQAPLDRRQGS